MGARPAERHRDDRGAGNGAALADGRRRVGAFAVTRLVATMLFRVDAADPATFLLAGLFLGVVA